MHIAANATLDYTALEIERYSDMSKSRKAERRRAIAASRYLQCILSSALLCSGVSVPASEKSNSDGDLLNAWLSCSVDTYIAERKVMTFDRDALMTSWSACRKYRDALLAVMPEARRDPFRRMLEAVHDSAIAEIIAAANQLDGYGLNRNQPVAVGGSWQEGVIRSIRYLESLRGPDGQKLRFVRVGSCCSFDTPNAPQDHKGRLEVYDLSHADQAESVIVYFNTYDEDELDVVEGFTRIPQQQP